MDEKSQMLEKEESRKYFTWNNGAMFQPSMSDLMHVTKEMLVPDDSPDITMCCEDLEDVRLALRICRDYNLPPVCRSGRHSTAGYSSGRGLIIDVSRMKTIQIFPDKKIMKVEAGATVGEIGRALERHRLHIPLAGCHTVGIAGYMQGGGYGYTSREFGINSDNVIGVTVMLASGQVVEAHESRNKDLFWAVRGGTGGNFGVLLDITYKLHDLGLVWAFALKWKLVDAPIALVELQENYTKNSRFSKVNYQAVLASIEGSDGKREPGFVMLGMYSGTQADGEEAIASLMKLPGTECIFSKNSTYGALNDELFGLLNPPPKGKDIVLLPIKRCGYISKRLTLVEWTSVAHFFATTPNAFNLIAIEPYGGTIQSYPIKESAFIHREVFMDLFANSYYDTKNVVTSETEARRWFAEFENLMASHYSEHRYQNYPMRGFDNYRWAYWGDAFNSLLFVKKKYDPQNMFKFEQSISPCPAGGVVKCPEAPSMFSDLKIE